MSPLAVSAAAAARCCQPLLLLLPAIAGLPLGGSTTFNRPPWMCSSAEGGAKAQRPAPTKLERRPGGWWVSLTKSAIWVITRAE